MEFAFPNMQPMASKHHCNFQFIRNLYSQKDAVNDTEWKKKVKNKKLQTKAVATIKITNNGNIR